MTNTGALGVATWVVIAIGVALRCVSYFRRDILWLDEAATARNIIERSLPDLLTVPVDYGQSAPKGFLLVEWLVTHVLGSSELAFRLIPFLSGIVSLLVFAAIARRLLLPLGALAALLFFSVGYWFLVYSADTHPYGLDLALSLTALLLTIDLRRLGYPRGRVWGAAAFGAVAVWLSNGALIAMFGLGVALGAIAWRERGWRTTLGDLWPIAVLWGASAAATAWVSIHSLFPETNEFFRWAWQNGMVPVLRSPAAFRWLWDAWRTQLSLWHGWSVTDPAWTSLYVSLALIGLLSLLVRRTGDAILAGSVVAAYVLVSMAKQYPYDPRYLLASISVFVLGVGESIGVLASAVGRARIVTQTLALSLCVPPVYRVVAFPPPYQWTVTGSYLAQIRDRWQPGDILYTTYGRALEVIVSAPKFGLRTSDYVVGPCNYGDYRVSLRAADAVRGHPRAWMIVGTGQYFPSSPEYGYLRTIGVRRDSLPVRLAGSIRSGEPEPFDIGTAYLFDLTDSTRLARATAETFTPSPLTRRMFRSGGRSGWDCYGVWNPLRRESGIGK
jgi:hypothetical protein